MGKIEIVEPLSRLEIVLLTWSDWMRSGGSVARGYPRKACGFAELGATSIEDMEDTIDAWLAKSIDSIIRGLPDQERNALHHQYLDSRYRYQSVFYAATLYRAREMVLAGMTKKRIW